MCVRVCVSGMVFPTTWLSSHHSLISNGIVKKEDQRVKLFWLLWNGWCSTPLYSNKQSQSVRLAEWAWCRFCSGEHSRVINNISPLNGQRSIRLPIFSDQDESSRSAMTPDFPLPPMPVSFHHPCLTFITSVSHNLASTLHPPLPPSALHAFTLNILSPYPQKNSDNSRGKFIRSKNRLVSVSVLLPWHIPQGCSTLWMALSVHFVWGSIHTFSAHIAHKKDISRGCSKSSYHLYSAALLLLTPPPPANLALVSSCSEKPNSY